LGRSAMSCLEVASWTIAPALYKLDYNPRTGRIRDAEAEKPTLQVLVGKCMAWDAPPYVKRQKNDAADAEAICEAVTRANNGRASNRSG
jgi:hypothetical protein